MFVHFINGKPVAISETNLFNKDNLRYLEFKSMTQKKGFEWSSDFTFARNNSYSLTVSQTRLFTTHENFDTNYYDLIHWLSGKDERRDITKNLD